MNMRFRPNRLIAALAAGCLAACGSSGSGSDSTPPPTSSAPQPTQITQPTTVNLYPSQSTSSAPLLRVMVTSVGATTVNMALGFDTGSAGVTLYAQSIFPPSMVSASGFVFPTGQSTITYNGITVTNLQGTRSYGTLNQTVEHGNLAFAELTFGDASGTVTTQVMPIFLFYAIDDTTGTGYAPTSFWQGWFGVASTDGTIDVAGSTTPAAGFAGCATDSTVTCYVVSAMKYIDYGSQVNGGFLLSPAALQDCDSDTAGSCQPQPMLTVGVDASVESGFSTTPLVCPPNGYAGPASIAGYPVCQKSIEVSVAASGGSAGSFSGYAVFDTGTSYFYLSTPSNTVLAAGIDPGSTVTITTPSGFNYAYTADATATTNTNIDLGGDSDSIIGIQYFTTNFYLLDFTAGIVGWK
jgi:hypothetical protein